MSRMNTKQKAFSVINDYKLPDGSKAQWFVQLPNRWQDYILQVAETSMKGDMSICSLDIPDILEQIHDLTIWDATYGAFFPYEEV